MRINNTFSGRAKVGLLTILIIIICAAIYAYFWRNTKSPRDQAQRVTIAQAGDFFLYAPLYVALDAGFFREKGLNVSLVSTGGDEKTWAAVMSGSANFGVADPTFVAIADARGQPGRVIASIVDGVPFWGITWREDVPEIREAKELEPFIVATFPSPSTAYTLQKKMFTEAHLPTNIREGAFGTLQAMLKSGQADIALELEPNVSQAVIEGARVIYGMSDTYGEFAITGLTTTPELLRRNPELANKVVCGIQLAIDSIRQHPQEALKILAKRFPEIDPEVTKIALSRIIEEKIIPVEAIISDEAWKRAIQLRIDVGDLSLANPMETYVDNQMARDAALNCRLGQR